MSVDGTPESPLDMARRLHRAGRLTEAGRAYERILAADETAAEAWHLLGVVAHQQGEHDRAVDLIGRAIALTDDVRYRQNRANAYLASNRVDESADDFETVCRLAPSDPDGPFGLGLCRLRQGKLAEAAGHFTTAVDLDPSFADARMNLGLIVERQGDAAAAARHLSAALAAMPENLGGWLALARARAKLGESVESALEKALPLAGGRAQVLLEIGSLALGAGGYDMALRAFEAAAGTGPGTAQTHFGRANSLFMMGRVDESVQAYERTLQLDPDFVQAEYALSAALMRQKRQQEAGQCIDRALRRAPGDAYGHRIKAAFERRRGDEMAARAAYLRASSLDPDNVAARWGHLLSLPHIYESDQHVIDERARWIGGLTEIEESLDLSTPARIAAHLDIVRNYSPFSLHYQGFLDIDLQRRFAAIVGRIVRAAYPEHAEFRPAATAKARRRVGFVSAKLHRHTVHVLFKNWILGAADDRLEPYVFYTGDARDAEIERLAAAVPNFRAGFSSDGDLFRALRDAGLDAVIYPEIGMDSPTQLHASLRFAPRQFMSWGHPVTSGMPTIDGFLSSDLMEPADSAGHYSETLIRLPNLSVDVDRPAAAVARQGAPDGTTVLCQQSLFKLLPSFDRLVVRIAQHVPQATFRFIALPEAPINAAFERRMHAAFAAAGLDYASRVKMLPRMGEAAFLAETAAARILLDAPSWSGGRTSLEAFACHQPIVTLPGASMRARHTAAMYTRMDLDDLVCRDDDDYVARACAWLTQDDALKDDVARIAERAGRLYGDSSATAGLVDELMK